MERVQHFLQCDELKFDCVKYDKSHQSSISIRNANFFWGFQKFKDSKKKNNKRDKKLKKLEEVSSDISYLLVCNLLKCHFYSKKKTWIKQDHLINLNLEISLYAKMTKQHSMTKLRSKILTYK